MAIFIIASLSALGAREVRHPGAENIPHVGDAALRHVGAVQRLCQRHILIDILPELIGVVPHGVVQRVGAQQLEYHAIALPDPHRVIGNDGGDAVQESGAGKAAFLLNSGERLAGPVDLDNLVFVQTVHRAVAALADFLAALDAELAQLFAHVQQFGKAGGLKNLVDLR